MFIREYKQVNKKNNEVYVKHKLVASVRTNKGPRHKIIMPLGTLKIPRIDWKRLAHALECIITGKQSMLDDNDAELECLALKLISNNKLSKKLEIHNELKQQEQEEQQQETNHDHYEPIDLNSIKTMNTRGLGGELLCMKAWCILGFTDILRKLKFSITSISLTMVLLFGRIISPGSERHTIEWFRKRSALQELQGVSDLEKCGKDRYYEVADLLYANKNLIEDMLFQKERELFPHSQSMVYLYDITNTYLEGHGLGNTLAARGHCKSKRYDCPLVTLSLIVSDDGMPICSQIYSGNQSEPETMETMMKGLSQRLNDNKIPMFKPTVAMDRGIATEYNVKWLRENGYHYIVIKREDNSEAYWQQFEEYRDTFELVSSKKSIYGDENNVYIKKEQVSEDMCRVLCFSEGKARKEMAIADKKGDTFLDDIEKLRKSISIGTIKKPDKISNKLQRLLGKHGKRSRNYEVSLEMSEGKVTGILLIKKTVESKPLYGCYVIESSHADMSAQDVWKLYMTLTRVESAFRSMKETLGMRPVYHQKADRTAAHLFITVLAYHLLSTIENLMAEHGDNRTWGTLRDIMSTLTRSTVTMRNAQGETYNIRISGEPEDAHRDIMNKLGISSLPKQVISKIDTL